VGDEGSRDGDSDVVSPVASTGVAPRPGSRDGAALPKDGLSRAWSSTSPGLHRPAARNLPNQVRRMEEASSCLVASVWKPSSRLRPSRAWPGPARGGAVGIILANVQYRRSDVRHHNNPMSPYE
jgi:hypothetical protein